MAATVQLRCPPPGDSRRWWARCAPGPCERRRGGSSAGAVP